MTNINPGSGATIQSTTLGGFIWNLSTWAISAQKDIVKNPNLLDYLSLSIDNETEYPNFPTANGGKATIDFSPLIKIDGLNISIPDYLVDHGFLSGTGGTFSGNWAEQLFEAIITLHRLQLNPAKNPFNLELVSFTITGQSSGSIVNASMQSTIEIPLTQTFSPEGNLILRGASPMGEI
jgi:hypothetical protein